MDRSIVQIVKICTDSSAMDSVVCPRRSVEVQFCDFVQVILVTLRGYNDNDFAGFSRRCKYIVIVAVDLISLTRSGGPFCA